MDCSRTFSRVKAVQGTFYCTAAEAPSIRPISETLVLRATASSFSIGRLVNKELRFSRERSAWQKA